MKKILVPVVLLFLAANVSASGIDTVRHQFLDYYTAAGADRTAPRMSEALGTLEWVARAHAGALRSDGSWPDLQYNQIPDGGWDPWAHAQRLFVLAKAYTTPGQALYRDPQLLADINAALSYTRTFYGATVLPVGNWWFWTIGIPIELGPTLVLMKEYADPAVVDDLIQAIHFRIRNSPTGRGLVGPLPTGQNLVWSSFTHLCLALLKDDAPRLAAVRDAMTSVARPAAGEGIQKDMSFHQHGAQLYTGGYGGAFAADVARYALFARGTFYSLTPDALDSFLNYVADGIAWSLHGDYFDVSVISREVARPSTSGFNGMAALVQAAQIDSPRTGEIRAAASKILESWRGTMNTELAGAAVQVESARLSGAWPSGHRHYFASDYTIHRRPGWYASVKMFSTRTKSGEKTNSENLLGSRQSDGRLYLVLHGSEYFGRDIWPALDWSRLPGITVEQKAGAASDVYGYGTRSLAGGTGDGRNGVSAMELAPLQSSLTARKSWFFFDDAIVFLTNGIRSTSANRIETVVNQWPLVNPSSTLARGPDWAHLEGIGYWFPSTTSIHSATSARSGTWAALGGSSDTTVHTKSFVTLWIDHGVAPVNESAEYVLVPKISREAMQTWAASRPISILANNESVSAVRDQRNGNLGITFWRAAAVDGIQSSAAAVVYVTRDGDTMKVSAADPNANTTGSFLLTIPGAWRTADVPSQRTPRATILTIPRASGETTTVTLTPITPKRRAARR